MASDITIASPCFSNDLFKKEQSFVQSMIHVYFGRSKMGYQSMNQNFTLPNRYSGIYYSCDVEDQSANSILLQDRY